MGVCRSASSSMVPGRLAATEAFATPCSSCHLGRQADGWDSHSFQEAGFVIGASLVSD